MAGAGVDEDIAFGIRSDSGDLAQMNVIRELEQVRRIEADLWNGLSACRDSGKQRRSE
jgi:hypothetical protein